MSETRKPQDDPSSRLPGCSLITAVGSLIGFVLGGLHGIREYNAAVETAMRQDGFADYLPVGVPIWAFVGAVLGLLASIPLMIGQRLISRPAKEGFR